MTKKILLYILIYSIYANNQWDLEEIEYLIYTNNSMLSSATNLSNLHEYDVDINDRLKTKIVIDDTLSTTINEYIENNNLNNIYFTIIGDESIIPPIFFNTIPCDACFSTPSNMTPNPRLITGRIIASNNEKANTIINTTRSYILNPYPGDWKSELLLFCDDQYKIGKQIEDEIQHTKESSNIYESLKNNLNINCLYGPMFDRVPSSDWYTQPDFTEILIQSINKGLGIINYIGHGTSEFLADEDILTYSDVDLISIENNKLPIWIVGTCSFGNYLNERCFAEKILNKGNAGIAVISTTGNLSYESTYHFIDTILSEKLIESLTDNNNPRLGQIFYSSIQNLQPYSIASLHFFGDPALKLHIPKLEPIIQNFNNNFESIIIGEENNLILDNNNYYALRIINSDRTINNIWDNSGGLLYQNGETLFYGNNLNELEFNDYINFILPLDAYQFNNVTIKLYKEENNTIQIINNIPLEISNGTHLFDDLTGPTITIYQNNNLISNNSYIYPPYNLKVQFEDSSPINISNLFNHEIKLWIDNNYQILNGYIPIYNGGFINCHIDSNYITQSNHTLKIEAWDILNNKGSIDYDVNFYQDNNLVYNVFNFPNPFKDKTFLTFGYENSEPLTINIKIFTINGVQIYSNSIYLESNNEHFYKFSWDGVDNNKNKVPKGIYLYQLDILKNNKSIHQGIYKMAKI